MQEKRIRVSVVDDHRVFAEALAGRLSDEPDIEVVGTASGPAEAFELFSRNDIDVVVLDLDLAGEDGLAVGRQLRQERPDLAIVVVTAATDDSRAAEAVTAHSRAGSRTRRDSPAGVDPDSGPCLALGAKQVA